MATARQCRERPVPTQRIDDPRPVALVGLMGAGKSCVGRRLAAALGRSFIDADDEIVKAAGLSVSDIFSLYGEAAFRDVERKVMARVLTGPPCVLATGGGAFMDAETRALIRDRAVSVWLRADLEILVARTAGRTHRPLLNTGNPRDTLKRLMEERYPVYGEADLVVDTGADSADHTTARVLAALAAGAAPPGDGTPA
ncbi:shikimate kinase [uncultured Rhodospira sp.]|uniref:shikimate kinase n=1 Tax=uncultured Rhodospira sp. TaxID=1936189 RepID=UPI00262376B0|nr:shikimate kinase [uncultured Rhodospira sp.]